MNSENTGQSGSRTRREVSRLFTTVATSYGLGLVGILPSIITVYFSTRVFAPQVFGQLALIATTASLIQSVGFTWLSSALIRFGREEYVRSGGVHQTFRIRLILLSVIWLVAFFAFGALYIFARGLLTLRLGLSGRFLWAVPLFLTLWIFNAELTGYLTVFGRYVRVAAASLAGQLFQATALALLFWNLGTAGIDWLILLSFGGALSQSLYLMLWLKWEDFRLGANTIDRRNTLYGTVRYSSSAIAISILGYIHSPIEYYLILYFLSVAAVGLFSTANSMNAVFVQLVMLFPTLMFPILQGLKTDGKLEVLHRYFHRIVPQLTVLFALGVSIALVVLPPAIRHLLNERYHPAIGALLILACAEIPHMTTALESVYSAVYDKLSQNVWVTSLQYVFQLTFYFFLIPRIGIEGVAWGSFAAYLASSFLLNYYVSQEFGFLFGANFAVALSAALGLGALLLARSEIPFIIQLLALLAMVISTCAAIKVAKLFESRDVELLMATGIPSFLKVPLRTLYHLLS